MKKLKIRTIRAIVIVILIAAITIGYITNYSIGTFSAVGFRELAMLCPLGAFETMLASKHFVTKALVSLAATVLLFALCGRAFCAWICPVPLVSRLPQNIQAWFNKSQPPAAAKSGKSAKNAKNTNSAISVKSAFEPSDQPAPSPATAAAPGLLGKLRAWLLPAKSNCQQAGNQAACTSCAQKRGYFDSRHVVLAGSLASAFVFGFPVFCAICPLGLTIAAILLVVQLFALGEVTWTLAYAPLVLLLEVVFFRKWCQVFCPLSAITSLLSKLTVTMKLRIDDKKCLETSKSRTCQACAKVCPERINPRYPERSYSLMCECTKCYECVEACPTKALKIPFLPWRTGAYSRVLDQDLPVPDLAQPDEQSNKQDTEKS